MVIIICVNFAGSDEIGHVWFAVLAGIRNPYAKKGYPLPFPLSVIILCVDFVGSDVAGHVWFAV